MAKIPVVAFVDLDSIPVSRVEPCEGLPEVLEALARERIMLVFCSQGTRAQMESARQAFGVFHPFVCEGGAAAFVPERYFGADVESTRKVGGYQAIEFGSSYESVVDTLRRVADRLNVGVLGFNDMSVEQVARECGLSLLDARLAKLREYGEPFRLLWANPIAERRLFNALESAGLMCVRGAGFHYAGTGPGLQPAAAVLTTLYRVAFGGIVTVSVGEGAPHVDLPLPLPQWDAGTAQKWLEWIVHEIDDVRAARLSPEAARLAR